MVALTPHASPHCYHIVVSHPIRAGSTRWQWTLHWEGGVRLVLLRLPSGQKLATNIIAREHYSCIQYTNQAQTYIMAHNVEFSLLGSQVWACLPAPPTGPPTQRPKLLCWARCGCAAMGCCWSSASIMSSSGSRWCPPRREANSLRRVALTPYRRSGWAGRGRQGEAQAGRFTCA